MEMDAQVKLAVAMSILRDRSQSARDVQHWKKKAKERKNKLAKLKHDLKEIQGVYLNYENVARFLVANNMKFWLLATNFNTSWIDDMLSKMLPQVASCKCNFFENSDNLSLEGQVRNVERDTYSINQVLFRQFLRQVHLTKRLKNHKDSSAGSYLPNGPPVEDEKEKLASATNFLLEIIDMQSPAYSKQLFSTYSHQAVDFIKDTLQILLAREEDDKFIVELVNNLAMHLVERIYSISKYHELDSASHDKQFHVQHIMRKLGTVPFIGQRILLAASQAIASLADSLLCMGPFDSTIPQVHNCMFIMLQLVEHLVSDYTYSWAMDPTFCDRLLEEWVSCYFQVKKGTDMLEPRNSLYTVYIDRITGELAKQLNKIASLKEQDNRNIHKCIDIWSSLFT